MHNPLLSTLRRKLKTNLSNFVAYQIIQMAVRFITILKLVFLLCFTSGLFAQSKAQEVVDKSIKVHGGKKYSKKDFQFDFRKKTCSYHNDGTLYEYRRHYTKDGNEIQDVLNNEGFIRSIDGIIQSLDDKQIRAGSNGVNSVIYFAMLPHFLNDKAVYKEYLGKTVIKNQEYHKVKVHFDEVNGGDDHDDIFVYWFNVKNYKLDYLAYSYEVNGGGVRFREAYNSRKVGGVIFQDYINYKGDKNIDVQEMDRLFLEGKLKELSRIELENVKLIR